MHELQQILLQKLPRLSKLIFGGRIRLVMEEPLVHNHILEALGEDWAMTGGYQLMKKYKYPYGYICFDPINENKMFPKLPTNISDLSLPEYEETRKQLISLLK